MRHKILRGDRLRRERERLGLSQHELAKRIGAGANQFSRYETGEADPLPYQLKRIAQELGVTTDYLLGLSDQRVALTTLTPAEQRFLTALRQGELDQLLQLVEETRRERQ